jgi:PIN domain nuclease of toxin-antitoxin system
MRRLLIDSHILLWYSQDALGSIKQSIEKADYCYFSIVSIWELAIKSGLGRLEFDPVQFTEKMQGHGFLMLELKPTHIEEVKSLVRHHNDPFDRMLVAQAMAENLVLLTSDNILGSYSARHVKVITA